MNALKGTAFLRRKIILILFFLGTTLLVLTCSSLVVSLSVSDTIKKPGDNIGEEYSPTIASINSLREFEDNIRTEIQQRELSGIDIPILIDDYVRRKYFFEYSFIPWYDNWILAFVDVLFPEKYIMGRMKPDELIRFDYGICNQQAIVFQKIVNDFGFEYGSVRFSTVGGGGHFASAVLVNGEWYYFDPNLEPEYDRTNPEIFSKLILRDKETLRDLYGDTGLISSDTIELGDINTFPARKGVFVQNLAFILSWYGWAFFFIPSAIALLHRRRVQRSSGQRVTSQMDDNLPSIDLET